MKNYLKLLFGILLLISSLRPFFESEFEKKYDILGISMSVYVYVTLHFLLGIALIFSFYKNRKDKKP